MLIDEAHLLLTQGSQSYSGSNQLYDILRRAKVAIVVFDPEQVLRGSQFVDAQESRLLGLTGSEQDKSSSRPVLIREKSRDGQYVREDTFQVSHVHLGRQMRIQADPATCAWLDRMTAKDGVIGPLHPDPWEHPYEIKVFDSPKDLRKFIRQKDQEQRVKGSLGLCRLLSTYDWPYSSKKHPDPQDSSRHWQVVLRQEDSGQWVWAEDGQEGDGEFAMPWNYELYEAQGNSAANHRIAWASCPSPSMRWAPYSPFRVLTSTTRGSSSDPRSPTGMERSNSNRSLVATHWRLISGRSRIWILWTIFGMSSMCCSNEGCTDWGYSQWIPSFGIDWPGQWVGSPRSGADQPNAPASIECQSAVLCFGLWPRAYL